MKVLAVDYGKKHIGLASGDTEGRIAFPKDVILRKSDEQAMAELLRVVRDEGYGVVVFGAPRNMDGGQGRQYEITMKFVDEFKAAVKEDGAGVGDVSVEMMDERLSSFEAGAVLENLTGMRKREGDRDMMAAKVILERWFLQVG